jgi:hypothetical protein
LAYNAIMQFDWQLIIALGIVAAAVLYIARLGWKALRGKSAGCGSCGSCSSSKAGEKGVPLVAIGEAEEVASGR